MNNISRQLNMLNSGRIRYIDYTKGFAILLMVFGHVEVCNEYIYNWIYSFHMPIFFLISGILMYVRESNNGRIKWYDLLKKRFRQLAIPYTVFCLILALYFSLLQWISGEFITMSFYMGQIFTLRGILALWFLPCYAFAEVLSAMIIQISRYLCVIPFSLFFLCYYGLNIESIYIANVVRMLLGCVMVLLGYFLQKWDVISKCPIVMALILLSIGSILSQFEGHTAMHALYLGNLFVYFITFLIMSISLFSIFKYMEIKYADSKLSHFLTFWGTNSIVVLCTHNLFLEIFRLLDYKLFNHAIRDSGLIGSVPLTILILLFEIPVVYLANHRLFFLFGRKHA